MKAIRENIKYFRGLPRNGSQSSSVLLSKVSLDAHWEASKGSLTILAATICLVASSFAESGITCHVGEAPISGLCSLLPWYMCGSPKRLMQASWRMFSNAARIDCLAGSTSQISELHGR